MGTSLKTAPSPAPISRLPKTCLVPTLKVLKEKNTRKSPNRVKENYSIVPPAILICNQNVTLAADIMFVSEVPFLVTLSRAINKGTIDNLNNMKCETAMKSMKSVIALYKKWDFKVEKVLTDGQFKPWRQELNTNGTELNVVSKYKHVSDIERYVRTSKERRRATCNSLPYTHFGLPMIIMVEMMCTNISWLNVFPVEDGVSSHIGSCQIITCHLPDYELHCRLQFSTCLQAHIKGDN